jgi:hypothetical protein
MVRFIEGGTVFNAYQYVLKAMALPPRIVNIIGRHVSYVQGSGKACQFTARAPVFRAQVILKLDPEVLPAKDFKIALSAGGGLITFASKN